MANFDEDIRRITNEVLQDGTVDQIIREKVTDGIKGAISDSFGYGKLRNAIKERVEQVLVPFIEKYDMSDYIVKLDTVWRYKRCWKKRANNAYLQSHYSGSKCKRRGTGSERR